MVCGSYIHITCFCMLLLCFDVCKCERYWNKVVMSFTRYRWMRLLAPMDAFYTSDRILGLLLRAIPP